MNTGAQITNAWPDPTATANPVVAAGRALKRLRAVSLAEEARCPNIDSQDVGQALMDLVPYVVGAGGAANPLPPPAAPLLAAAFPQQPAPAPPVNPPPNPPPAVAPPPIPRWAAQLVRLVNRNHAQVIGRLDRIEARLENAEARLINMHASFPDGLEPLRDANGNVPAGFPATYAAVGRLTPQELSTLLNAYGREVPRRVEDRLRAFARFIGIRL